MDYTSVGFVGLVIVLGGIIAFWADRLGRYLGKRRLRLFGLRPRHTAAILTIAAGVLTPLVTVAIVFAASRDVRMWLLEGARAVEQVQGLREEVAGLKETGLNLDEQIRDKGAQAAVLDAQLQMAETDLKAARADAAKFAEAARQASAQLASLTKRAAQLTTSLEEKTKVLAATTGELTSAQTNLELAKRDFAELSGAFAVLTKDQDEAYKENRRLDIENDKLLKDADRLKLEISGLGRDKADLQVEQGRLAADLEGTQAELERGKLELDGLRAQLSTASNLLRQNLNVSRTMPMIYRLGEELARYSMPAELTRDDARSALATLLRSARILADQNGAKGDPPAGIWYRETPERVITIEEQEEAIVRGLTGQRDNLVLVATSMLNAFQGEFVALDVRAYRNPIVYRAGQVVVETRVNGQLSEDRVLQLINEFVRVQVREKALAASMIPIQGQSQSIGEVSQEDVLALMREIRAASRQVRVLAIALQDTRAADPLKLEFRIR